MPTVGAWTWYSQCHDILGYGLHGVTSLVPFHTKVFTRTTTYKIATSPWVISDTELYTHFCIKTQVMLSQMEFERKCFFQYTSIWIIQCYFEQCRTDRVCNKTININGTVIPEGMGVAIPIAGIHLNPDIWPDPEKFDPDRWAKIDAHTLYNMA